MRERRTEKGKSEKTFPHFSPCKESALLWGMREEGGGCCPRGRKRHAHHFKHTFLGGAGDREFDIFLLLTHVSTNSPAAAAGQECPRKKHSKFEVN